MNIQTSILIILLSFSLSYSQSKKEVERNLFFFEKNIDSNSDIAYYYLISFIAYSIINGTTMV